jgi:site-specific DNA-cytosine methylase
MRVLIACEESQVVTKAFRVLGHDAWSCDIQDCSGGHPEWHIKGDVLKILSNDWDLMIGHPPCTYLSYADTGYWDQPGRLEKRLQALKFFAKLWLAPIEFICLENPKGCASPTIAKYSQEIQPYYFGDGELKTTLLWLKNLPLLKYSFHANLFESKTAVEKPEPVYTDKSGKKRYFCDAISGKTHFGLTGQKQRSKTFPGIAAAMASQWTDYINLKKAA